MARSEPDLDNSIECMKSGETSLRRDETGWTSIDISSSLEWLNLIGGHARDVAMTRDASGRIHLVVATPPDDSPAAWYDPRHELFHLMLNEEGRTLSFSQITNTDPEHAHWLPALENWDWTRPKECCSNGPWLMFTRGQNLGGAGGNNVNTLKTEVHLMSL